MLRDTGSWTQIDCMRDKCPPHYAIHHSGPAQPQELVIQGWMGTDRHLIYSVLEKHLKDQAKCSAPSFHGTEGPGIREYLTGNGPRRPPVSSCRRNQTISGPRKHHITSDLPSSRAGVKFQSTEINKANISCGSQISVLYLPWIDFLITTTPTCSESPHLEKNKGTKE